MADETVVSRNPIISKLGGWEYHVVLTWAAKKRLLRRIAAWVQKVENWRKDELARLREEAATASDPARVAELAAMAPEDVSLPLELTLEQFEALEEGLGEALVKVVAPDGTDVPPVPDELLAEHSWTLMQALARVETPDEVLAELPTPGGATHTSAG